MHVLTGRDVDQDQRLPSPELEPAHVTAHRWNREVDPGLADRVLFVRIEQLTVIGTLAQSDGKRAAFGIGEGDQRPGQILHRHTRGLAVEPLILRSVEESLEAIIRWCLVEVMQDHGRHEPTLNDLE